MNAGMQQCLNDSNFAHNVCFHLSCRPKAFNAMLMSLSNAGFVKPGSYVLTNAVKGAFEGALISVKI